MYTAFYNLKEQPFRLTPDPRYLHLAEPHRVALKVLLEGILLRKGFIVMEGPIGTGKTTILHAALHMLSETPSKSDRLATAFLVNPTLERNEFLEAVLDEFEIPCDAVSKPRRLAALHQMLLETQRRGATAVLFVDEAHLLTPELLEEIRLLSNADTYQEKLLQIVLCGQPELNDLLARPESRATRQRIAATCELRPLTQPETRAYVTERLYAAGLREGSLFAGPALEAIHDLTGGVPRLINLLCDNCLSIGFGMRRKQIETDVVAEAASALGLEAYSRLPARPSPAPDPRMNPEIVRSKQNAWGVPSADVQPFRSVESSRSHGLGASRFDDERATSQVSQRPVEESEHTGSNMLGIPATTGPALFVGANSTQAAPAPFGRAPVSVPSISSVAATQVPTSQPQSAVEILSDALKQGRYASGE